MQGQPIHNQAVRAPPAAASASHSHVDVGAAGHQLPPDCRHEARALLTAAPPVVVFVIFIVFSAIRRLAPAATDVDAALETMTSGAFPPLGPKAVGGRGHTPLAAWTHLLLHRSFSSRSLLIRASVLVCNVVVGERVHRTNC